MPRCSSQDQQGRAQQDGAVSRRAPVGRQERSLVSAGTTAPVEHPKPDPEKSSYRQCNHHKLADHELTSFRIHVCAGWRSDRADGHQLRHHGDDAWETMSNPSWIVLAWLVVAFASAVKFWSITRPYRKKAAPFNQQTVDEARQRLERRWRKDSKV